MSSLKIVVIFIESCLNFWGQYSPYFHHHLRNKKNRLILNHESMSRLAAGPRWGTQGVPRITRQWGGPTASKLESRAAPQHGREILQQHFHHGHEQPGEKKRKSWVNNSLRLMSN